MLNATNSPTLRAHTLIQQNVTSIKGRLETARSEAVTGQIVDVGRAVNGDTAKVNLLSESIAYAKDRTTVLDFEGSRMTTAQAALDGVRGHASATVSALLVATGAADSTAAQIAEQTARVGLEATVSQLNTSFGGRPLFGGDSGDTPLGGAGPMLDALRTLVASAPDTATALTDIETWFDDPAGGFATAFFRGGDGDAPTVELDKGERAATSLRADDQALRDVMRGLAITALATEETDETARSAMQGAGQDILNTAGGGILELQAGLGVQEERVAGARADHEAQSATLSIAYTGLTTRDQAEAATEMRMLESQLEAAYLTTSRMANLSLINYMR